jgi:hypothetical protein
MSALCTILNIVHALSGRLKAGLTLPSNNLQSKKINVFDQLREIWGVIPKFQKYQYDTK